MVESALAISHPMNKSVSSREIYEGFTHRGAGKNAKGMKRPLHDTSHAKPFEVSNFYPYPLVLHYDSSSRAVYTPSASRFKTSRPRMTSWVQPHVQLHPHPISIVDPVAPCVSRTHECIRYEGRKPPHHDSRTVVIPR